MQAVYIIDQSWHVGRWDLQSTVKGIYEDRREHNKAKTQAF